MAGAGELQQLQQKMGLEAKAAGTKIGGGEVPGTGAFVKRRKRKGELQTRARGKVAPVEAQLLIRAKEHGREIQALPAERDTKRGI